MPGTSKPKNPHPPTAEGKVPLAPNSSAQITPPEVEAYTDPTSEPQIVEHLSPITNTSLTTAATDEWDPHLLEILAETLENPNHTFEDLASIMHEQELQSQGKGLPMPDLPRSFFENRDMDAIIHISCAQNVLAEHDPHVPWRRHDEQNDRSTSAISQIRGVVGKPLSGMKTIEGTALLPQWLTSEHADQDYRKYRIPVRFAISPGAPLFEDLEQTFNTSYFADGRIDERLMTKMLENLLGGMTDSVDRDIAGEVGSTNPDHNAVNTLIETAQAHPGTPISLIHAHGTTFKQYPGYLYLQTGAGPNDYTELSSVIAEIRARDSALGHRTSTVVLCSCNRTGLPLHYSSVTLIYRTGLAGGDQTTRTGRLTIDNPTAQGPRPFWRRRNR